MSQPNLCSLQLKKERILARNLYLIPKHLTIVSVICYTKKPLCSELIHKVTIITIHKTNIASIVMRIRYLFITYCIKTTTEIK